MSDGFARDLNLPPFPEVTSDYLPGNVSVHFHLGPHSSPEHLNDERPLFKDCDIYVPELSGSHPALIKELDPISKRNQKSLDRVCGWQRSEFKEYNIEFLKMLYGSWKPVALVDVDHDRKDLRIKHGPDNGIAERVGKTIDETLNNYADGIADEIRRPGLRDRIIIAELGPAVTGIVVKNPKLRDKEDVKTLVKLGNLHFNTYAYLAGSEQMADRVGLSYWSGLRQIPVQDRIRHMFLAGEAPSRQDMLELMIAWALEGLAYYDPRLEYDSKPSMPNEFAKRAIQLMLNDEENGAHEMAHKAVGRNYEGNIKKGIKAYVVKAGNIIVQELEAASVSNAST